MGTRIYDTVGPVLVIGLVLKLGAPLSPAATSRVERGLHATTS
jgi:hypothetical protein